MHVPHSTAGTVRKLLQPAGRLAALLLAAVAHHGPAHAYQIEERYDSAFQRAGAGLGYGVYGGPWQPPIATPGQRSDYQIITPGTTTSPFAPGRYIGGDGVAFESTVQGPAVFYPNIEQPFQAHAWAVASNRTGQLVAHAHGTQFEQIRTMPLPMGITGPQFDGLWAIGTSTAQSSNFWNISLNRSAASQLATQPLTFGLTLEVNARYAPNPDNASHLPRPIELGYSTLEVSLTFRRLVPWVAGSTPEMPDGGPLEVTTSQTYLFNGDNQGRQTLRIEQSIGELTHWWSEVDKDFTLGRNGDLRARSCLDMRAGIFWDDLCSISVTADIRLFTYSNHHMAEADVSATWDATQNGSTDSIWKITTSAPQWGEPISPLLATRPSLATPVPEAGVWWMVLAGLGVVAWRQYRARP
jgi:hypothetical protein